MQVLDQMVALSLPSTKMVMLYVAIVLLIVIILLVAGKILKRSGLTKSLSQVEWPTNGEVAGRFGLVIVVLITLIVVIAVVDGLLGYLLGFIY